MNVDPTWMVPKPGRFGQLSPGDDTPARPAKRLEKRHFAIAKIGHDGGLLNMHGPTVGPSRFADVDRALRLCFGHHANLGVPARQSLPAQHSLRFGAQPRQ